MTVPHEPHDDRERAAPVVPPGSLCEVCLDAMAVSFQPAPWGGEMGICMVCGGERKW